MNITVKNENKFLNILYGTSKENYNMTRKEIRTIIKEHIRSLDRIYYHLDELNVLGEEQYDLGDTINLMYQFLDNMKYEKESN